MNKVTMETKQAEVSINLIHRENGPQVWKFRVGK